MLGDIGRGFCQLAQPDAFNNALGAIDGCHFRIKPTRHNHYDYFKYKLFYSVQVQAICDSSGRFTDICVGYGGSVHDTRVLSNSPIYVSFFVPLIWLFSFGRWRLYPCLERPITIIAPYRHPLQGGMQERYNGGGVPCSRHWRLSLHFVLKSSWSLQSSTTCA